MVKSTIDLIAKYKQVIGKIGKSVVSMMSKNHKKYIVENESKSKISYPEKIILEDLNWDRRLNEIKHFIEAGIQSNDEKIKIAAHNLDFFLTQHSLLNCSIHFPHNHLHQGMFKNYQQDQELRKSAKIIGADNLLVELEGINANFNALHDLKIEENSENLNELVKIVRTNMDN